MELVSKQEVLDIVNSWHDGCFYWEDHDMEDVVAWMPLPKPFVKGEEQNNDEVKEDSN